MPVVADRTQELGADVAPPAVRGFTLTVVEGPAAGTTFQATGERCSLGSAPSNDLVIDDTTVSRFHCEIITDAGSARVRDQGSLNGTMVDGVVVLEAFLRGGSLLKLGRSTISFQFAVERRLPTSTRESFGELVGRSVAMRATFALLERAAASDATVLLEGETGTGKERAAEAIHEAGPRSAGPFVVVDCSAIPGHLLESELFGSDQGEGRQRMGAFEEADGGTVFLDQIGELALELQPKLLRVLEQRQIRRTGVGSSGAPPRAIDVRVVAATNRDLRAEVNAGRFRPDLYHRLAVLRILMPPLRARPDDLPALVDQLLTRLNTPRDGAAAAHVRDPRFLATLETFAWPGNVRELKTYLERCLVFAEHAEPPAGGLATAPDSDADASAPAIELDRPYIEARERAQARWESRYLGALMAAHGGKVTRAAQAAGVDRAYLYRLLHRHGIK